MGNILSRIQEIAIKEGITITAMERSIGASKGVLSRAIANGTDIQSKWLQNIVENYPLYSADWLITGRGSMLRHEPTSTNFAPTASLPINNDFVSIPLVDISVAAGCCGYDNPDYLEVVDTIKMPLSMVRNSEKYFCVRIKGESMSPTLLDSSYVNCEITSTVPNGRTCPTSTFMLSVTLMGVHISNASKTDFASMVFSSVCQIIL